MKARAHFRRRRENKTDYKARLAMLKSDKPRLVARLTNRRAIAQLMTFESAGDRTITQADSKEFEKWGWEWKKNSAACYLVGFALARRALAAGVSEAIFDAGLRTPIRGGRLAAVVKGAVDGGLKIAHNPEILPPEERIIGKDPDAFKKFKEQLMAETPKAAIKAAKAKAPKTTKKGLM